MISPLGKTVVITGGNTGIGKETARILAWRKARVILACRNITKGLQAAADIIENTGNRNIEVKKLDLSSFQSVRDFAEEINQQEERVDVLINNAGYLGPFTSTVDGKLMLIKSSLKQRKGILDISTTITSANCASFFSHWS